MLLIVILFFILDKFLFVENVLLFKNRYERFNQEFLRKLPSSQAIEKDYFQQKLDHYNPTDTRTWKQVSLILFEGSMERTKCLSF